MRRPLILLALPLLALAACEMKVGKGDEAAETGANASVPAEKGHVSLEIPGFTGKLDIPAFDPGDDDMDIDGIRLYPGSRVSSVDIKAGKGDKDTVRLGYSSPDAPDKLQAYYEAAAKEKGFTVAPAVKQGSGTLLHLTSAKGKSIEISIEQQATGSQGALTIVD
ncbi:hypothetical protein SAMN06295912_101446 [Sphingomonas laterariae]|uniref:Lipoprotein n=1 Tax=Edaphosphingomonas laterariae TaxID=861865 RepID=A0A239BXA8_9SPHN|nr:hypothetical protein [Sphingomonas laterariae]SNS12279.1 hypothetical protein SAMN06295912_101446 [Sphingomonas laterariae]